jgi:hypothetical protein
LHHYRPLGVAVKPAGEGPNFHPGDPAEPWDWRHHEVSALAVLLVSDETM